MSRENLSVSETYDKSECSSLKLLSINSNEEQRVKNENFVDNELDNQSKHESENDESENKTETKENHESTLDPSKLLMKTDTCMMEWVAVVSEEDDEPIEIPTESDGTMLLSSLAAQFSGATGIKFRNPATNMLRGIRMLDNILYPPKGEQGWGSRTYICARAPGADSKDRKPNKKGDSTMKRKFENDPGAMLPKNQRVDQIDVDDIEDGIYDSGTCDLIVLGLPFSAEEEDLRSYFEDFGDLLMVQLKLNRDGSSKGFGFIRFKDLDAQETVVLTRHKINNRWCEVKVPDSQELKCQMEDISYKIYVSGISESFTIEDLKEHFEKFGKVTDVFISKPFRNFAFVSFKESRTAKSLYYQNHTIKGKKVLINPAAPKGVSKSVSECSFHRRDNRYARDSFEISRGNRSMGNWRDQHGMDYQPFPRQYGGRDNQDKNERLEVYSGGLTSPWIRSSSDNERYIHDFNQRRGFL